MKYKHYLIVGIVLCIGFSFIGLGAVIAVAKASFYMTRFPSFAISLFGFLGLLGIYGVGGMLYYLSNNAHFMSFLKVGSTHDLDFTTYQVQKQFAVRDWDQINKKVLAETRAIQIKLGDKVESLLEEVAEPLEQEIKKETVIVSKLETEGKKRELGEIPTSFNHAVLKASSIASLLQATKVRSSRKVTI